MEKEKQKFNSYRIKPESRLFCPIIMSAFVVDVVLVVIFDAVADVRIVAAVAAVAVVGVAETSVRWSSR